MVLSLPKQGMLFTVSPYKVSVVSMFVAVAAVVMVNEVTDPAELTVSTLLPTGIPVPETYWPTAILLLESQVIVTLVSVESLLPSVNGSSPP